jgi:hypothetical protein
MGNSSYLCGTDKKLTYPSFKDADYKSEEQTIAMDVYAVPLLWLCLFKQNDLVKETLENEGYVYNLVSPLTETERALENLEKSESFLCKLFEKERLTKKYFEMLKQAISSTRKKYITAEIQEIACLEEEEKYYQKFREAIELIERQEMSEATRQSIVRISDLRLDKVFPDADIFTNNQSFTDDEGWNHTRLLGASLFRQVPWE